MSQFVESACFVFFALLVALPGLYGFHMYWLLVLARRRREPVRAEQRATIEAYQRRTPPDGWPHVTTQLPIYNEVTVARRIIEAAARMEYPRDKHEIQVLDDSTDGTRAVVDQVAMELRSKGHDVKVVRRPTREHYKAGALAYGLRTARGTFVAVFDADFIPDPGFLRRMIPLIATRPDVCAVQGRWGHLNARENWITQSLSLSLDMLFAVEQGARNWNGYLMSFNGTGGVWRKEAIDDPRVGGWSGDTITEDLDLSYRAQLAGWKMVYTMDEVSPAELPADVNALKSQQRRWAVGTIQTARKLVPRVWRSRLSLVQKLEASFHLLQYAIYLPMILVALLGTWLQVILKGNTWFTWAQYAGSTFLLAAVAPAIVHIYARRVVGGRNPGLLGILKLMTLGLGLCVNNALGVLRGFVQRGGEFVRTPKSGGTGPRTESVYASIQSRLWLIEVLMGVYVLAQWVAFPGQFFLPLYGTGLILLGWQSRPTRDERQRVVKVRVAPAQQAAPAAGATAADIFVATSFRL